MPMDKSGIYGIIKNTIVNWHDFELIIIHNYVTNGHHMEMCYFAYPVGNKREK